MGSVTDSRDPVELLPSDGFAHSGRVAGFIPKTIFYKEETANSAVEIPVSFFQDFGIPDVRQIFYSIDEHPYMEMTLADIVDRGEGWLLQNGFCPPGDIAVRKSEWIPIWPPMLYLVEEEPAWRSVDFEESRIARKIRQRREALDREIANRCLLCGRNRSDLAIAEIAGKYRVVHGLVYEEAVMCDSEGLHKTRDTVMGKLIPGKEEVA